MKVSNNVSQSLKGMESSSLDKTDSSKGADKNKEVSNGFNNEAAKVDLSNRAQEMAKIKELAMNAPDVDESNVARLQKLIDEGKYEVDAEKVADKLIDDHLGFFANEES